MLEIDRLSKTYPDGTTALQDVSFSVNRGEFLVILGPSGSGKSTLLRCINRLVEPTGGRIVWDGKDVTSLSPRRLRAMRRKIGMIFQNYNLVRRTSVLTNTLAGRLGYVSSFSALVNHFPREAVRHGAEVLNELGIGEKRFQRAETLSGGQQQRVGIARALMQDPELLLADEPVSSLDPASSRTILDILRSINRTREVTLLCNLHLPELAREYGSRVLALKKGRLVYDGPPQGLDRDTVAQIYESP